MSLALRTMSSQHDWLKVNGRARHGANMSQQDAGGQGAGCSSGARKGWYFPKGGGIDTTKPHKSPITEIAQDTFNTGHNKFAAQFSQSRKIVANYLQWSSVAKGYLVPETVCTGKEQIIKLPPPARSGQGCSRCGGPQDHQGRRGEVHG